MIYFLNNKVLDKDLSMKLTEHFSLAEATVTSQKVDNTPTPTHLVNIKKTAAQLEKVREACGNVPLTITSFYRSVALNNAVGGSKTSAHSMGYAVDFKTSSLTVAEVCEMVNKAGIRYDQLIDEKDSSGARWVHISFDPRYRQQHLKMRVVGGVKTYTTV